MVFDGYKCVHLAARTHVILTIDVRKHAVDGIRCGVSVLLGGSVQFSTHPPPSALVFYWERERQREAERAAANWWLRFPIFNVVVYPR